VPAHEYEQPYGDLATLNTERLILDSVGPELLTDVARDTLDVLETSMAVYERRGDYASGIFASGWCRLMDQSSRRLCETNNNSDAIGCGKWLCHEHCWGSAEASMDAGESIERSCPGGIQLFAVPIVAADEVVGAISMGHGNPALEPHAHEQLATRFQVDVDDIRKQAHAYEPRPSRVVELAKIRAVTAASLIGTIVEQTRLARGGTLELERAQERLRTVIADRTRAEARRHRDITKRRAAEQELRKTEVQLQRAQKMDAIGRLAGGIAHDFNNLLTVIQGRVSLQLKRLDVDDPLRAGSEAISRAAEQGAKVAKQLLTISRKRVVQPQLLDLNQVVRDMTEVVGRLLGTHIAVSVDLGPDLGVVMVDRGQIEQVLLNLSVNSRDAMPEGGELSITTRNRAGLDETGVGVGPQVRLSVSDTGTGMNEKTLSHMFEPFFTTKEEGQGTGLGLAMAYAIITDSGGGIEVDSQVGRGTTFHIDLPQQRRHSLEKPALRAAPSPPRASGATTILLVEDHDDLRALMRDALNAKGHTVLDASTGAAALDVVERHSGTIDLLVTDVVLPGMSGPGLARQVSLSRPEMRTLYVSGYALDAIVRRGVTAGPEDLLYKPFTPRDLLHKVRDALQRPARSETDQGPGRSLHIDADKKLVVLRVRGTVHASDIAQIGEEYGRHPLYDPSYDSIIDARELDSQFGLDELRSLLDAVRSKGITPTGRRAFVVDSPRETALAMLYGQLVSSRQSRVFSTEEAAYEWLGRAR
jgi:signal transduction histidine kinase/ActR/RegA family two-component response regulator|tara:strand:- start:4718 stop:6988 length:2271 start_codon:yes stop_codon:yes gene_type:complete